MKKDFICADRYTPEVFEKVLLLKGSGRWSQIAAFMGREYGAEWLDFLEGCGEETPFEVIRRMPLPATHAAFLRDCATFVTQAVDQLTVTREAALALCYGLERPAENLELVCSGGEAAGVLRRFCAARSVSLSLINEVLIRREFLIRSATDELRVIVSYRKARAVPTPMIRGIRVSEPDTLASRACFAFNRSRHLRDLYDLAFVIRLFFDRISEERKFDISNALSYFESSDLEYLLRTQEDCLIDKTKLVNDYRAMCRLLGISSDEFLP